MTDAVSGEVVGRGPTPSGAAAAPGATPPPGVAAAVRRLGALDDAPVSEHVEVFDEVHRLLQDALATLDEA